MHETALLAFSARLTGQPVKKVSLTESARQVIDLSGYAKRIYFVRVSDGTWLETQRIVVG